MQTQTIQNIIESVSLANCSKTIVLHNENNCKRGPLIIVNRGPTVLQLDYIQNTMTNAWSKVILFPTQPVKLNPF